MKRIITIFLVVLTLCTSACNSSEETLITQVGEIGYSKGMTQKEYDDALKKVQEHEFIFVTPEGKALGTFQMITDELPDDQKFFTAIQYQEDGFDTLEWMFEYAWFRSTDVRRKDFVPDGKVTVSGRPMQ